MSVSDYILRPWHRSMGIAPVCARGRGPSGRARLRSSLECAVQAAKGDPRAERQKSSLKRTRSCIRTWIGCAGGSELRDERVESIVARVEPPLTGQDSQLFQQTWIRRRFLSLRNINAEGRTGARAHQHDSTPTMLPVVPVVRHRSLHSLAPSHPQPGSGILLRH